MTLTELSATYRQEEQRLDGQIARFLPIAKQLTGTARREAYRRLQCLYEMRREVRLTAQTLEHYYEKKEKGRIYRKNGQYFFPNA